MYNAGETADLSAIKVVLNDKEVVAASKVVSAANKEANIFYSMQVEVEVTGTDASTLKFVADVADNTVGFRLYNIRLYGVEGGTAPEPSGELLKNGSFEVWMILSQKVGGENLQLMLPIVNIQKARKMVRCRC